MPTMFENIYSSLRSDVLSRHFALGCFWRMNHFTNTNVLGDVGDCFIPAGMQIRMRGCEVPPCLPRASGQARYVTPTLVIVNPAGDVSGVPKPIEQTPLGVSEVERWRVWNHDHGNGLDMTGLRLIHLSVDHRLGDPVAAKVILSTLNTVDALFKYPADTEFGGYVLRWDPVADDSWRLKIDKTGAVGRVTPTIPCRFLINPDPVKERWASQPYLYCTPLDDPRYLADGVLHRDRYRGWEPSKDEYIGLLVGLSSVWNAFPAGTQQHDLVVEQARRVALYLQRHAYLLVRPCRGVAFRGCGELLPLFEFVFTRVFQHILGQPFESSRAYRDVLSDAGITFPQMVGTIGNYSIVELQHLIGNVRQWLQDHRIPGLPGGDDLNNQLTDGQKRELAWIWQNRAMIDALDEQMQAEVLAGYVFNLMPRDLRKKTFEQWMTNINPGAADGFKPLLALMLLNVGDDYALDEYLTWFDTKFTAPPYTNVRDDEAQDWALPTAVAMLVAHKRGDTVRHLQYASWVEKLLHEMGGQILADNALAGSDRPRPLLIFGAGSTPLSDGEMIDQTGLSCGAGAPHSLVSEVHDKAGNWYGFMPVLGLAWRHLLDSVPNPFSAGSGISLPTGASVASWPPPRVPSAVIKEAIHDPVRMLLPLSAMSVSNPHPSGDQDVALFIDPPPRATDQQVADFYSPKPTGAVVSFDFVGEANPKQFSQEWTFPPLAGVPDAEMPNWVPIATLDVATNNLSDHWSLQRTPVNGKIKLDVWLKAAQVDHTTKNTAFGTISIPHLTYARVAGNVRMAWTPR